MNFVAEFHVAFSSRPPTPPVSRTKVVVLSVETLLGSVAFSVSCGKRGTVCPQGAEPRSVFQSQHDARVSRWLLPGS